MTRAFWLFSKNSNSGSTNENSPTLPSGLSGKWTNPGDIVRLKTVAGHEHLMIGGYAVANDELADGHYHLVAKINDNWQQITQMGTTHTHPLDLSLSGEIIPDWFLLFYVGPNSDYDLIDAHAQCLIVVECPIGADDLIGEMESVKWTAAEQSWWTDKILVLLGIELPSAIDRGKRLISLFLGCFLSRPILDERGYRYSSV